MACFQYVFLSFSHQRLSYIDNVFGEAIPEGIRQLKDKGRPKMNQTIVVNNITYCWNEILRKYTPSFLCDDPIDYLDDEIDISYQVAPGNPNFFLFLYIWEINIALFQHP